MTECRAGMTDWRGDGKSEYEGNHVRMSRETCSTGGSRTLKARSARTGPQMSQQDNTGSAQTLSSLLLPPRRPASRRATSFSSHEHVTLERLVPVVRPQIRYTSRDARASAGPEGGS